MEREIERRGEMGREERERVGERQREAREVVGRVGAIESGEGREWGGERGVE